LPDVIPAQGVDVPSAQVDAINCVIEIIDEPYTGDEFADYNSASEQDRRRVRVAFAQDTNVEGNRLEATVSRRSSAASSPTKVA
jgi:hypothetical protein